MGACTSKDSAAVRQTPAAPPAPLRPPPPLVRHYSAFKLPPSIRGTKVAAAATLPTNCLSDLWVELRDGKDLQCVHKAQFLNLLQRKSREPSRYLLFDLQPRMDYARSHIKLSLNPWKFNATVDTSSEEKFEVLRRSLEESIKDKIVLLYGAQTDPFRDPALEVFLRLTARGQPRQLVLCNESLELFATRYPHWHRDSPLLIPGPMEFLAGDQTNYCLLCGDQKLLRCPDLLWDVYDVRGVVSLSTKGNIDENPLPINDVFKFRPTDYSGRGTWYAEATAKVVALSSQNLPILVVDDMDGHHASIVCAFAMIFLGWTKDDAVQEIIRKCVGGNPFLADEATNGALGSIGLKPIEEAYPQWHEDVQCISSVK